MSMQDRCTVCVKRIIGSENRFGRKIGAWFALNVPLARKSFWTHPMEHLGDVGYVEPHLFPYGDSVSVDAR